MGTIGTLLLISHYFGFFVALDVIVFNFAKAGAFSLLAQANQSTTIAQARNTYVNKKSLASVRGFFIYITLMHEVRTLTESEHATHYHRHCLNYHRHQYN